MTAKKVTPTPARRKVVATVAAVAVVAGVSMVIAHGLSHSATPVEVTASNAPPVGQATGGVNSSRAPSIVSTSQVTYPAGSGSLTWRKLPGCAGLGCSPVPPSGTEALHLAQPAQRLADGTFQVSLLEVNTALTANLNIAGYKSGSVTIISGSAPPPRSQFRVYASVPVHFGGGAWPGPSAGTGSFWRDSHGTCVLTLQATSATSASGSVNCPHMTMVGAQNYRAEYQVSVTFTVHT